MPPGVLAADASAILPRDEVDRCQSIEAFGDVFRYELLFREGGWWADVDVFCLTDRLPDARYAWAEEEPGVINGAILKFPPGEPIVAELAMKARALARQVKTWGAAGPRLLSDVLRSFEPGETSRLHVGVLSLALARCAAIAAAKIPIRKFGDEPETRCSCICGRARSSTSVST